MPGSKCNYILPSLPPQPLCLSDWSQGSRPDYRCLCSSVLCFSFISFRCWLIGYVWQTKLVNVHVCYAFQFSIEWLVDYCCCWRWMTIFNIYSGSALGRTRLGRAPSHWAVSSTTMTAIWTRCRICPPPPPTCSIANALRPISHLCCCCGTVDTVDRR